MAEEKVKEPTNAEKISALRLKVDEAKKELQEVQLRPDLIVRDIQAAKEVLGKAIMAHDDFVRSLQKTPEGQIRCMRCNKFFDPKPVAQQVPTLTKDKTGHVSGISMRTVYERSKGRPINHFGGAIGCPHCGFPVAHSEAEIERKNKEKK